MLIDKRGHAGPFFMKKCFGFNSYYHINPQGLPTFLHDTGQPSLL